MIKFIKHIDIEGPATIGKFLDKHNLAYRVIDLERGEKLPEKLDGIEAVISLGGPMNVYEEAKHPYLVEENIFIQDVIREEIPYMGLCLGSQLLAKACGSKVIKSPNKEIGFMDIELTDEGKRDILFKGLSNKFNVFQWHEDMSQVPENANLLATSNKCPVQAYKVGSVAYGIQFHMEITDKSIVEWSDKYMLNDSDFLEVKEEMLRAYQNQRDTFDNMASIIYSNFFKLTKVFV